eukprot:3446699-Amphidinium_carterae.1
MLTLLSPAAMYPSEFSKHLPDRASNMRTRKSQGAVSRLVMLSSCLFVPGFCHSQRMVFGLLHKD